MDNEPTGLAAYVDQQFAAALGDGVRGSDPNAADGAGLPAQEEVAPDPAVETDALSGDDVGPDGETVAEATPEPEDIPDHPAADAVRQELEQLRAEKAERDRKELEALQAQQRAEAARRQQEQIAGFEREFAKFDEYDDGLGQRAKAIAAQIASTALQIEASEKQRLQQEADYHGRTASALIQVLQAEAPEMLDRIKPLVKQAMALNSPEEQGSFVSQITERVKTATAAKDAEIAALKAQLKQQALQQQARGLTENPALATGGGTGAAAPPPATDEPVSFSDFFDRQVAAARSGSR